GGKAVPFSKLRLSIVIKQSDSHVDAPVRHRGDDFLSLCSSSRDERRGFPPQGGLPVGRSQRTNHRLGGSLWMNSGHSRSITMRISSEIIWIASTSTRYSCSRRRSSGVMALPPMV